MSQQPKTNTDVDDITCVFKDKYESVKIAKNKS